MRHTHTHTKTQIPETFHAMIIMNSEEVFVSSLWVFFIFFGIKFLHEKKRHNNVQWNQKRVNSLQYSRCKFPALRFKKKESHFFPFYTSSFWVKETRARFIISSTVEVDIAFGIRFKQSDFHFIFFLFFTFWVVKAFCISLGK